MTERFIIAALLALCGILLVAGGIVNWDVHGHVTVLGLALICLAIGTAFA